jgi:peptidoglycan/xylan/chitin deacetylase (PgdA/CDA1 family)/thiamine kinase-like enzyme
MMELIRGYGYKLNHLNNMEYKSLSIKSLLQGKIGNFINRGLKNKKIKVKNIPDYQLVKDITPSYTAKKNRVGIYKNAGGRKVVIKKVIYSIENLDSIYLRNEAYILKTLKKVKLHKIFPTFTDFIESENQVAFITEYFEGKNVDTLDKKIRCEIAAKALSVLRLLSKDLEKENFYNLPIRKPFYYLLSFPLSLVKVIQKNPSSIFKYLKFSIWFYTNYSCVALGDFKLGFVHRDLYPDNILYSFKNKEIKIIDWESAIVSDNLYDLSQIAMIYTQDFGSENMIKILGKYLTNNSEKRRLIGLAVFNSIQVLGNNQVNHPVFKQTEEFLDILASDFAPKIINKKSVFEIINSITMDVIDKFYKITRFSKKNKNKKIVLCYHSVGDTGWRFSTRINEFEKQLIYLKKNYKLLNLGDLLKSDKGGIHITFDDGYQDVIENALPLLEKENIPATMFALSNSQKANRLELDNDLPIINYDQIRVLIKRGWEIGSHTRTHANLAMINESELENEIVKSKLELEQNLKRPIKYLAYPKGIYSAKVMDIARKAGYEAAFTVEGFGLKNDTNKMKLSRISIEGNLTSKQFEALLSPIGIFVSGVFMEILRIKANLIK